jgi:hypothetical protein
MTAPNFFTPTDRTTVTVFFNEAPHHFFGYQPTHSVRQVFTYTTTAPPEHAAEEAFRLFNMDLEWLSGWELETATTYRLAHLRSLSVGDVLKINETWWACASVGFTELDEAPSTDHKPGEGQ